MDRPRIETTTTVKVWISTSKELWIFSILTKLSLLELQSQKLEAVAIESNLHRAHSNKHSPPPEETDASLHIAVSGLLSEEQSWVVLTATVLFLCKLIPREMKGRMTERTFFHHLGLILDLRSHAQIEVSAFGKTYRAWAEIVVFKEGRKKGR